MQNGTLCFNHISDDVVESAHGSVEYDFLSESIAARIVFEVSAVKVVLIDSCSHPIRFATKKKDLQIMWGRIAGRNTSSQPFFDHDAVVDICRGVYNKYLLACKYLLELYCPDISGRIPAEMPIIHNVWNKGYDPKLPYCVRWMGGEFWSMESNYSGSFVLLKLRTYEFFYNDKEYSSIAEIIKDTANKLPVNAVLRSLPLPIYRELVEYCIPNFCGN